MLSPVDRFLLKLLSGVCDVTVADGRVSQHVNQSDVISDKDENVTGRGFNDDDGGENVIDRGVNESMNVAHVGIEEGVNVADRGVD